MRLCCFLNYAPLYRRAIFARLDEAFDCRFYFGKRPEGKGAQGIEKMDYDFFRHRPVEFRNVKRGPLLWRSKIIRLALGRYDAYLLTWDTCLSYPLFMLIARLRGKRIYVWGHGLKHLKHRGAPLDRWMLRRVDGFFIYGRKGKERMVELGMEPDKIHVISNSLTGRIDRSDDSRLADPVISDHFGNHLPTLLFIGRLTAVKKLDMIFRAAAINRFHGLDYNILIIGDGPERPALERLSRELGLEERTWMYGACYDEQALNRLIYNCDFCCSPGNVGLTALHALGYGVPVITHDDFETQMPEYEAIIPGQTGALFERDNVEAMASAIEEWLRSHDTTEARQQVRADCHRAINAEWNADSQIEVFKRFIR
ncbi:MAG: glycosyltransferase family 1 protein [Muribaculaceae bacterium]|nr:glycosyltransferase family 1 protein [Muribaculaceae bacterium]